MSSSSDIDTSDYSSNPFNFNTPTKEVKNFVGREEELEKIVYYLSQAKHSKFYHLAVIGERAVGKTSLLNVINEKCMGDFLPVKISLNSNLVDSQVEFFKELYESITAKASSEEKIDKSLYKKLRNVFANLKVEGELNLGFLTFFIGAQKREKSIDVPQRVLKEDLKSLFEKCQKDGVESIVLLIDEADFLRENEIILQKIRNIFSEIDGYNLVLSGTKKMFEGLKKVFSPMPRFFKNINLRPFTLEETKDCITKPLTEEEKIDLDKKCLREIHKLTGGSPYEVQLIAHYMYKKYKEENSKISLSPEVLEEIRNELEIIRKSGDYTIAEKIKNLPPHYLQVLIGAFKFPEVPKEWLVEYLLLEDFETLDLENLASKRKVNRNIIEKLQKENLIVKEEGKLQFAGSQFAKIYLKYCAASKEILKNLNKVNPPIGEVPLQNLHNTLLQDVILEENFSEYKCFTLFDRDVFRKKSRQLFSIFFQGTLESKESRTIFELPSDQEAIYKDLPGAVRFRTNVKWMEQGFLTQLQFEKNKDKQKQRLLNKLNSIKEKLEALNYEILLEDEITWYNKGIEYAKKREWPKAIECYEQALEINPFLIRALMNKGLLHRKREEYDKALKCYKKALKIKPESNNVLEEKGILFVEMGKNKEALTLLSDVLKQNPKSWKAWHNKGRAHLNLEQYKEALNCFDKAHSIERKNPMILYGKGVTLFNLDRSKDALDTFEKIMNEFSSDHPQYPPKTVLLLMKAHSLFQLENFQEALTHYKKIVSQKPDKKVAWYHKALCEIELGKKEAALKSMKKIKEEKRLNIDVKDMSTNDIRNLVSLTSRKENKHTDNEMGKQESLKEETTETSGKTCS